MVACLRAAAIAASLVVLTTAATLRGPVVKAPAANATKVLTAERAKLEKISGGLSQLLKAGGSLAESKIAPSLRAFSAELGATLQETKNATDPHAALARLHAAQASIQGLVKDITSQQVKLMRQGNEQEESLLLGVLMARQHQPMEKQLEVLQSKEFRSLPAVVAVLKAHDHTTPLFQQVAKFLDGKSNASTALAEANATTVAASEHSGLKKEAHLAEIVTALETRLQKLKASETRRAALHKQSMTRMEEAAKDEEKKKKHTVAKKFRLIKRAEERTFAKEAALARKDSQALQAAIKAIKEGDVKALQKAQSALQGTLKAMEAQHGGFLVLISLAHQVEGLDCPYCTAQCVEKCHGSGQPYGTCLTKCDEEGKGQ